MAQVQDFEECNQCGYAYAHFILDYRDDSDWLMCPRCGYTYESGPVYDPETQEPVLDDRGKWRWKTTEHKGYGVFYYRKNGARAFCLQPLNAGEAERFKPEIEKSRAAGEFEPGPLYLTRWKDSTCGVELLCGEFLPETSPDDKKESHEIKTLESWAPEDAMPF